MKFTKKAILATATTLSLGATLGAAPASADTGMNQLKEATNFINTAIGTVNKLGTLNTEANKLATSSEGFQNNPAAAGNALLAAAGIGLVLALIIGLTS